MCNLTWSKALLREQDAKIAQTARGISITKHFVRVLQPLSEEGNTSGQRQPLYDRRWEVQEINWKQSPNTCSSWDTPLQRWCTEILGERKQTWTETHNTYFYYITINRSSTVWQKKWQIPDHFTARTPKNIKNFKTVVFFFFLNLVSGMTNIPVTQPNDGKTGSHCICSTSNKAQCTKCACFSLHYTKIVKIHSR